MYRAAKHFLILSPSRSTDLFGGAGTYNVRVRAYEGEGCTGCEPCTAACNAEAVLGGKARPGEPGYDPHSRVQDNQDDLGPRSLLPCQLGTVRFYGPP